MVGMFEGEEIEVSQTLLVYTRESCYKYFDLFSEHFYEVAECGDIIVYVRDKCTGDERVMARFKVWDYFIIE